MTNTFRLLYHGIDYSRKLFYDRSSCGMFYKTIRIVNDTSKVVRMMIERDAPCCDIARGFIYNTRINNYAPREHL
jgi:hypothetical protein